MGIKQKRRERRIAKITAYRDLMRKEVARLYAINPNWDEIKKYVAKYVDRMIKENPQESELIYKALETLLDGI